jgi:F-type H+-transporting ATPase subunit b
MLASLILPLAQAETHAAEEESSNFLVSPNVGLMIWTLLAFIVTLWLLNKLAFPRIKEALDKRATAIEDSIQAAELSKNEAQKLLEEYRERLKEARVQADDIVVRARKNAEAYERESQEQARHKREELLEQTRKDIEAETRRAISEIRGEVADLTITATEKVTGRVLTGDDQRRLVDEAVGELDFSALSGERRRN